MRGTERCDETLRLDPEERDFLVCFLDGQDVLVDPLIGPRRRLLEKLRGER